ncbi:hypothetical protein PN462_14675 [Spirulina sp. CS-785/01]|uniref:hypothetical protein n=1 Tax=Spirulina sp. CS-785/01 TaxID=3021716 RepID=UPI00232B89FA|nr:hypothetical protein [Spirulina sp. CS-785/01]MDB9314354.1 hypothetical protein [Spirulina sp. CS-785/01]
MGRKFWHPIALVVLLGTFSPPSVAQNLNEQLRNAICNQNWGGAIEIIDRMAERSPENAESLRTYRQRLETLRNAEVRIPDWSENCQIEALPSANSPTPDSGPASSEGNAVTILNKLKDCTPYRSDPIDIILFEAIIEIKGPQGERCAVDYSYADGPTYMSCLYRPDAIAILTDEVAYEESRKLDAGESVDISFDTSNPRDRALSEAINRDCQVLDPQRQ